jgi:hypothetical protein
MAAFMHTGIHSPEKHEGEMPIVNTCSRPTTINNNKQDNNNNIKLLLGATMKTGTLLSSK